MKLLYSVKSVKEIQDLNPFVVVGCGGGGEKFSNLEGVNAIGFIDDNVKKQGKEFPADLLRAGEVRCEGVIYRPIWDTMEFVFACQDGVACSFKDMPGYYVPRNWRL